MSIRALLALCALSLSIVACGRPEGLAGARDVDCVYRLLKSDPHVSSIEVFRRDSFRSAIEYTFHDAKGDRGEGLDFTTVGTRTSYAGPNDADQWMHLSLNRKCSLQSNVIDDLEPPPPPRSQWQQVEWPPKT